MGKDGHQGGPGIEGVDLGLRRVGLCVRVEI